jgi:hypothetical protein
MKKFTSKPHLSRKKKTWLTVIVGILVISLSWWAWNEFVPRPLGDKLEYLGKKDYGNLLGFDSFPYSVYFYSTDMEASEAVEYFAKGHIIDEPSTQKETSFTLQTSNGETFRVSFYTKDAFEDKYSNLPKPKNDYVLSIPSFKYNVAKDSL